MRTYNLVSNHRKHITLLDCKLCIPIFDSPLSKLSVVSYSSGSDFIYFFKSDISLLFDQERLNKLNPTILNSLFSSIRNSSVDTSNFTDEQLLSNLKSRYIQSTGDVYRYTRYINSHIEDYVNSLNSSNVSVSSPGVDNSSEISNNTNT